MNKKFIFKYEPQASVKEMFTHFREVVKTGQKHIQPKNVSITNDLAVISRILNKTRLELFSVIRKKRPNNIQDLAQLLQRDYVDVWRDCQVLANCKVIKLKKTNLETKSITRSRIKPVALYDQIVIDFPALTNKETRPEVRLSHIN